MLQHRRSGQALAELAIALPLIAIILVSMVDVALLLYAHNQVANAAREGARAASLYRSLRYTATNDAGNPNRQCTSGIAGWSVTDIAQQAIVTRAITNQGCRDATGAITASAFGWLDPAPATNPWTLTITPVPTNSGPTPGDRATLTLVYPYRLVILSSFVRALRDPTPISKSVNFEYTP
jgi:Flp pilus assembly protein TadG